MNNKMLNDLIFIKDHSSVSNRKIASFIIENISTIDKYGLYDIAESTETSYATVSRFFKKIAPSGYKDFKKEIKLLHDSQHIPNITEYSFDIPGNASYDIISKKIHDFSSSVIATSQISNDVLERVVEVLKNTDIIYFCGLGTSAVVAHYAYIKFLRLNMVCCYDTDVLMTKMKSVLPNDNQVFFLISSSGRTKSIIDIAKNAGIHNNTVISLCDFSNSPLSKMADINICTTLRESNRYIDLDAPLIHEQITIIDVLYKCLSKYKGTDAFYKTKKSVENLKIINP